MVLVYATYPHSGCSDSADFFLSLQVFPGMDLCLFFCYLHLRVCMRETGKKLRLVVCA